MKLRLHGKPRWMAGIGLAMAFFAGVVPAMAAGADYPNRQITVLVGFPPGGFTDIMARRFAMYLQTELKANVIVENKPGASGQIASAQVAKSAPDGFTLLVATTHHVISPAIYEKLPYDTVKDFKPIADLAEAPNVLLVNMDIPVNNVQEYLAYARKHPGGLAFGSTSVGGSTHFSGELLALNGKAPLFHVPYKGAGPMMSDLMGGQVPSAFNDIQSAAPFIRSNKVKALGVTSRERVAGFPDIPTLIEQGVPDFEVTTFVGLYGPAGMSPELVNRLNKWAIASSNTPETLDFLTKGGSVASKKTPEDFANYVNSEIVKYQRVAKERHIKVDY